LRSELFELGLERFDMFFVLLDLVVNLGNLRWIVRWEIILVREIDFCLAIFFHSQHFLLAKGV
jgi:hypothetical protein